MFTSGGFDAQRFRYWQGQKLRSADLRDQLKMEAELRWWHNRALHQAYGVNNGLKVTPEESTGKVTAVRVECGLAYDCYGRSLLLQTAREIELPKFNPNASRITLVASYKPTNSFPRSAETSCGCGHVDQPDFVWFPTSKVMVTDGVPLAQLSYESSASLDTLPPEADFSKVEAGKTRRIRYEARRRQLIFIGPMSADEQTELLTLSSDDAYKKAIEALSEESEKVPVFDDGFQPPASRPLARPRVASGATVSGDTPWEPWVEQVLLTRRDLPVPVGMQVTVDTEAAGFTETPCYFAWLEGTLWDRSNVEFFPVPFTHIDRERTGSFRFRLWMPQLVTVLGSRSRVANLDFEDEFINYARQHNLQVCWMGIQEAPAVAGCETNKPQPCATHNQP